MISYIVQEKELRQKELLKMMSVTEFDIELSCTLVSSFLFRQSDALMLWLFWMMTFISITMFSTALAASSSKTTRGILVGLLVFFSGLFLSLIFPMKHYSAAVINIIMIHPVATFSYAISLLGSLDDLNLGLRPHTVSYYDESSGSAFQSMFIAYMYSSTFWFVITWYLNRTVKPEYGQASEAWYFPFTVSYWKSFYRPRTNGSIKDGESATAADSEDMNDEDLPASEEVSEILRKQSLNGESIEIVNLHKQFGDKTAVNGLNLSMYNGHITALLGHNGKNVFCRKL
jgi:ABC-type multidrug transport system fused ATPase/permease subunit